MRKFKDVNELVNTLKPDSPVYCIRSDSIRVSTEFFKNNFPGKVLYAVKTNPHKTVLKHIINNGIKNFDCASISEIKLIKKLNLMRIYIICILLKVEMISRKLILI